MSYLHVILDIYSRYVMGWMLAPTERATLAQLLIDDTVTKQPRQRNMKYCSFKYFYFKLGGVGWQSVRMRVSRRPPSTEGAR